MDEIKTVRNNLTSQPRMISNNEDISSNQSVMQTRKSNKWPWIIIIVMLLLLGLGVFLLRDKLFSGEGEVQGVSTQKGSGYQAVFLDNGQVYFGKLSDVDSPYVILKDIYYLQVTQPPLQGSQSGQQQQEPKISLVKLGDELHGPVDEMRINRDQIIFYEDMKESAKVVQAIKEHKADPSAVNRQMPQAPSTSIPAQNPGQKNTAIPKADNANE